jgi:hypothetical protein
MTATLTMVTLPGGEREQGPRRQLHLLRCGFVRSAISAVEDWLRLISTFSQPVSRSAGGIPLYGAASLRPSALPHEFPELCGSVVLGRIIDGTYAGRAPSHRRAGCAGADDQDVNWAGSCEAFSRE